ncbi:MAG: hypothetical protein ABL907_18105 [Hyphomicrobium sp.]
MRFLSAVIATAALSGCAAPLLMMVPIAMTGAGYYKVYTMASGGSVEISVDESKVTAAQKADLAKIKSLAVWPDESTGVAFAETLGKSNRFLVVTPLKVDQSLRKLNIPVNTGTMTSVELNSALGRVTRDVNADAIVTAKLLTTKGEANYFSFDRANVTSSYLVSIYGRSRGATVVELPLSVKVIQGPDRPVEREIAVAAAQEVATKLVAISN